MRIVLPPPKWDKTNDCLDVSDFGRWAAEYQLSLLPPDTLFPHPGQIWEAVRDCQVGLEACMAFSSPKYLKWRLPNGVIVTEDAPGTRTIAYPYWKVWLQKGERVRVLADSSDNAAPKPARATLQPLRRNPSHESVVPKDLRATRNLSPAYKGYRLFVMTARPKWSLQEQAAYLNEDFRLVEDAA